jgi:hypothetical protein
LVEIALIFAVFSLQGAWPVPDVNEAHYLGKAIHFWNPDWLRGDFFMESPDTHKVFFFLFGWVSLWMTPLAFTWTIRVVTWLLLAWSWRRLSFAMIPRPWFSIVTAALFGCLTERCHMAGEWVIGGAEAKGFAFVLLFLGLESLLRNRWNRALWLFGAASAFHVLIGGWAVVATGFAWLWLTVVGSKQAIPENWMENAIESDAAKSSSTGGLPRLWDLWPGILGGFLLALLGVVPAVMLDWGADPETLRKAHSIYVFERLPHHLVLSGMRTDFIVRLLLLGLFWLVLGRITPACGMKRRLRAFITGCIAIACIGVLIHCLPLDRGDLAGLLRYYWFRMTDVAIPLGVALEVVALIAIWLRAGVGGVCNHTAESPVASADGSDGSTALPRKPDVKNVWRLRCARVGLALVFALIAFHLGDHVMTCMANSPPRSFKMRDYKAWMEMCDWIVHSGKIPADAAFITPRMSQTFKWYTGHSEVAVWKDEPQDARGLVEWRRRIDEIYGTDRKPPEPALRNSPGELTAEQLRALGAKYHADYVVAMEPVICPEAMPNQGKDAVKTPQPEPPPLPDLPEVFRNRSYIIYRLQ